MMWLFAVLVVAAMAVVGMVAAGRGGTMAEVYDDRRDVRVQADGPLTAADLAAVRFTTALRGYRVAEVDALLERLVAELRRRELEDARRAAAATDETTAQPRPDPSAQ